MTSDARIESVANTLVIQGYVERTEDDGWELTGEGFEAFIGLAPLVSLADLLMIAATMTQEWVEEAKKEQEEQDD